MQHYYNRLRYTMELGSMLLIGFVAGFIVGAAAVACYVMVAY